MTSFHAVPWSLRWARWLIQRLPMGRYRAMNLAARCLEPADPFVTDQPLRGSKTRFVCHLGDALVREAFFTGSYEPLESRLVEALLTSGQVFADVGANWGYFTLLAAPRVGPLGRVISLEPHPRLFDLLQTNVHLNGWNQVTVRREAAGAVADVLQLSSFAEQGGNWGLSHLVDADLLNRGPTLPVPVLPLDQLLDEAGVGRVDLVKIDIEGAEGLALQGMRQGLAQGRYQSLLLELHPHLLAQRGQNLAEALQPLLQNGYRGYWLDHSPQAIRQLAYHETRPWRQYLRPMTGLDTTDTWPHTLWLAAGASRSLQALQAAGCVL